VVHGKGSLIGKMAGDEWQKFANLRLLLTNQWTQPGKKLLFMGCELAQRTEWDEERELDWSVLADGRHAGVQRLVDRLNEIYKTRPAMHEMDTAPGGFQWLIADDDQGGVIAYIRRGHDPKTAVICALNTLPDVKHDLSLGAPFAGDWLEILNTDAHEYGGSGVGNMGRVSTTPLPCRGEPNTLRLTLPPLGAIVLEYDDSSGDKNSAPEGSPHAG